MGRPRRGRRHTDHGDPGRSEVRGGLERGPGRRVPAAAGAPEMVIGTAVAAAAVIGTESVGQGVAVWTWANMYGEMGARTI